MEKRLLIASVIANVLMYIFLISKNDKINVLEKDLENAGYACSQTLKDVFQLCKESQENICKDTTWRICYKDGDCPRIDVDTLMKKCQGNLD